MSEDKLSSFKAWLTPILMSILGIMIWHDLNEMKNDIKTLLAKDSANQIRIEQLEKDVDLLRKQMIICITTSRYAIKREEDEDLIVRKKK